MSRSKNPLIDLAEKEEEKFYYLFGENEGKLIVEISATGKGLIPELDTLIDIDRDDFELVNIDDQGVLPTDFEKNTDDIQIISDRSWTVEYRAKQENGELEQFAFGQPIWAEATAKYQRYDDADLQVVDPVVNLEKQYGSTNWAYLYWLLPLIAVGIAGGIFTTVRLNRPRPEPQSRFNLPDDINPFTVLTLLKDIKERNHLTDAWSHELDSSIDRIEQSYFGTAESDKTEDLSGLARTWVKRAK